MTMEPTYPILEHEYVSQAKTEPAQMITRRDVPEHCVISFFGEVNEKVVTERGAKIAVENRWEDRPHTVYEIEHLGKRLAFFHPGVGAPIAASLLEEAIAFGCRKFMVCGGCGILETMPVGRLMVVESALRDEGVSYHYVEPGRMIEVDPTVLAVMRDVLVERELPYLQVKTWTTDAPYRETQTVIDLRRAEGCLAVEMEAASLLAVARFRQVLLGQFLYAGDDLSGEIWDARGWQSRQEIRENLFWLAAEACLRL
jgi:uridine phosphorylase